MDSGEQTALPSAGGRHPVHRAPEQKKAQKKKNSRFLLPVCLHELRHRSSAAQGWDLLHWFPGSQPLDSGQTRNPTMGSPGCPACRQQIMELLGLHNTMSPFLIINLFIRISAIGSVSPEGPNQYITTILHFSSCFPLPLNYQNSNSYH